MERDFAARLRLAPSASAPSPTAAGGIAFRAPQEQFTADDFELGKIYGVGSYSKVMLDSQGRSKGSGFVSFTTVEAAQNAINGMNGKIVGTKPLFVALAQRKEERRAMLMGTSSKALGWHIPERKDFKCCFLPEISHVANFHFSQTRVYCYPLAEDP